VCEICCKLNPGCATEPPDRKSQRFVVLLASLSVSVTVPSPVPKVDSLSIASRSGAG
jgi:hypothetical protein